MKSDTKRPESAIQFEDIYDKFNDPEERLKRRILKARENKIENKKKEAGY